jgi:hypothetical protein
MERVYVVVGGLNVLCGIIRERSSVGTYVGLLRKNVRQKDVNEG